MTDSHNSARRPGHWPPGTRAPEADDQGAQHLALTAEQARWHVTLGVIRAHLEEQPSPQAVRAAARRWARAITQIADDINRGDQ